MGQKINSIFLASSNFELYEEYLLLLEVIEVKDKTLYGKVIQKKRLLPYTYSY